MKIVALVSGGKDSCYNMMQCVANGHEIVALANLKPPAQSGKDELDSFMYQTVGHDAIHFYSDCMDVPLYRREILGESLLQGSDYVETECDETEDLYLLLKDVLNHHPEVRGVSVGAILSNYQRVRVEHVCNRLGLTSLAYLWQRDQKELLAEMASAGVNAILIKVAAMGLKPVHLGKSIGQMFPMLCAMNEKYDLHICGEGGEYETFTIDCPLFKKRISVEETETIVHSDDAFAPVAYLRFLRCSVVEKTAEERQAHPENVTVQDWKAWPDYETVKSAVQNMPLKEKGRLKEIDAQTTESSDDIHSLHDVRERAPFYSIAGTTAYDHDASHIFADIQEETKACMTAVQDKLRAAGLDWRDVVMVNVLVADMQHFQHVNALYNKFFGINPPPRALVATQLCKPAQLQIDVTAAKGVPRETMHVQGISYWAPANIGPYSQSVVVSDHVFVAGQIGLEPSSLRLPEPRSFAEEASLSLRNLESIVTTLKLSLKTQIMLCYCYVSRPEFLPLAEAGFKAYMEDGTNPPTVYVAVSGLPKSAMVEWQVILYADPPQALYGDNDDDDDDTDNDSNDNKISTNNLAQLGVYATDKRIDNDNSMVELRLQGKYRATMVTATLSSKKSSISVEEIVKDLVGGLNESLRLCDQSWSSVLSMRLFYIEQVAENSVRQALDMELSHYLTESPAITMVSAQAVGKDGEGILSCTLHLIS
ncbi:uncharacterized protein BYT42DRAFT_589729 [Radiomyces spectabilis]|uniref:uncharacterized protein n=1 Tax=Radiomyces spectabilis TaxID=64574 RepID=UPI00221FC218|nr:uncharacterized protein BYT42DRAFT_589729 [Radiomyces spectabilis]KAI8365387.1 hypothetical protein BYT42DRAFT_589729 [Radiomyces spectabilis]